MSRVFSAAVDAVFAVNFTAANIAASASAWAKEWGSQQAMRSMAVDNLTKKLLARAAETTAAKIKEALDDAERLCEEINDAAAAADEAAKWLAKEAAKP